MPAERIHLVRHGKVENPEKILYGRLPGYHLSELGQRMAEDTARHIRAEYPLVRRLFCSPLERTRESAQYIADEFGLTAEPREALIEASNRMQGERVSASLEILTKPRYWRYLWNPLAPSWGEKFVDVADRMKRELAEARDSVPDGDVVLVSHELPIWMAHRVVSGKKPVHDPRKRRCALSSVTTIVPSNTAESGFEEIAYWDESSRLR